jgi:hypothetical protein
VFASAGTETTRVGGKWWTTHGKLWHDEVVHGDADALAKHLEGHPELRAAIERERAQFAARIAELEQERDRLRASHERLRQELELFKRRLFIAKAGVQEFLCTAGGLNLRRRKPHADERTDNRATSAERPRFSAAPAMKALTYFRASAQAPAALRQVKVTKPEFLAAGMGANLVRAQVHLVRNWVTEAAADPIVGRKVCLARNHAHVLVGTGGLEAAYRTIVAIVVDIDADRRAVVQWAVTQILVDCALPCTSGFDNAERVGRKAATGPAAAGRATAPTACGTATPSTRSARCSAIPA